MTTMNNVEFAVDSRQIACSLQSAGEKLNNADGELLLDFSSVRRVTPDSLRAMEDLLSSADEKGIKVVLRGVNVDIYKVLKLTRLAPRFSYRT